MAGQQAVARKSSRSKRSKQQEADSSADVNGREEGGETYEQELAAYLQERIRPGLNRGAIPLLARSIAKEIARRDRSEGASEEAEAEDQGSAEAEDEHSAEADDDYDAEAEDERAEADDDAEAEDERAEADDDAEAEDERAEADDDYDAEADEEPAEADDEEGAEAEVSAFEEEMHELQEDLGDEWILRFSVQGDDAWLTAEKDDGSQRLEAPTADVLRQAVELLNEGGGRSG